MRNIAALLVALAVPSLSFAQGSDEPVGSIIPRAKPATVDRASKGDAARQVFDDFAACLLGRRKRPVLDALALPSGSAEQNEAFRRLVTSQCIFSGELHFGAETFRGSFYTALVRSKFGRKGASLVAEPADYAKASSPGVGVPPSPYLVGLLNFASCVVHKDPENARVAVIATAGSPKEDAAMAELAKVYDQCVYSDTTLRFSKGSLVGLLAEAYYREGSASK